MNCCNFTGRIANELELKVAQNNTKFCRFSLAVRRDYKNKEGKYDADFINVIAFDNNAEFLCKYADKGSLIEITSKVNVSKFDKNGQNIYATDFGVVACSILKNKEQKQAVKQESNYEDTPEDTALEISDEDLPF